jgi:hypothetical protein
MALACRLAASLMSLERGLRCEVISGAGMRVCANMATPRKQSSRKSGVAVR